MTLSLPRKRRTTAVPNTPARMAASGLVGIALLVGGPSATNQDANEPQPTSDRPTSAAAQEPTKILHFSKPPNATVRFPEPPAEKTTAVAPPAPTSASVPVSPRRASEDKRSGETTNREKPSPVPPGQATPTSKQAPVTNQSAAAVACLPPLPKLPKISDKPKSETRLEAKPVAAEVASPAPTSSDAARMSPLKKKEEASVGVLPFPLPE